MPTAAGSTLFSRRLGCWQEFKVESLKLNSLFENADGIWVENKKRAGLLRLLKVMGSNAFTMPRTKS
jgi:hypothetical protein